MEAVARSDFSELRRRQRRTHRGGRPHHWRESAMAPPGRNAAPKHPVEAGSPSNTALTGCNHVRVSWIAIIGTGSSRVGLSRRPRGTAVLAMQQTGPLRPLELEDTGFRSRSWAANRGVRATRSSGAGSGQEKVRVEVQEGG